MGSIRPQYVKKIAIDLASSKPELFSENFHKNKEVLKTVIAGASKKDFNEITGYATRYMIKKRHRTEKEAEFTGEVVE
ncbi:MAG: 30S ribosomal protein S17e [Candidatus Thermoplasmatota archaeon]|nr:30S ribosomal protein S17e [Candidatus Thermoplasmatota archaeon]